MKVYVIGKYEHKEIVRDTINHLRSQGHVITEDWTVGPDAANLSGSSRLGTLQAAAQADFEGAQEADAVIVIHHDQLCGGLVEFGVAAANPRTILCVVGAPQPTARRQPIFYWLPRVRFFPHPWEAVDFLTECDKSGWH